MKSEVSIADQAKYQVASALLFYSSSRHSGESIVTEHAVEPGADGQPTLGAGRLLTLRDLDAVLSKVKGDDERAGFVPPNVLFTQRGCIAWWLPASQRTLHFRCSSEDNAVKVASFNGQRVWCPPLVFIARDRALQVYALAKNQRPDDKTELCVAPFWNIWESGQVCTGSVDVPEMTTFESLSAYEGAFFNSFFTHPNRQKLTTHPAGFAGLWSELATKGGRFASRNLVRLNLSLHEAVRP